MDSVEIGIGAWLAVQPVAVLVVLPLLRAASGPDPLASAIEEEPSPIVELARWSAAHER